MEYNVKPQLHANFSYQTLRVGREQTPLLVIDNFYQDPQSLVDYCVAAASFNQADNFYPGLRMPSPEIYPRAIYYYLGDLLDEIFGLKKDQWLGAKSLYSMVITPPEHLTPQQCAPHVDSIYNTDLACVHFLCSGDKGGTSLYRHKQTAFERITNERLGAYEQSINAERSVPQPKAYMNGSNNYFESIASVAAQFNRIVIYPGNVLHSGNIAADFTFDPNPRSGRLTLNSFIFGKR